MVQIVNGEVYPKPGHYETPRDEIPKDNRSKEIKSIVGQCIWRGDSLERCMAYVRVLREDGTLKINQKDFDETVPKIYQRISERREKNRKQNNSLLDDLVENKENIVINENDPALRLRIYTEKAIAAVKTHNEPPVVFMRSNTFSRVLFDEHNRPLIESMNDYAVSSIVERCIEFKEVKLNPPRVVNIDPPMSIIRDIVNTPWNDPLPPLVGLTECPIIHRDGTLTTKSGYDPDTRMYYATNTTVDLQNIPNEPTDEQVKAAVAVLEDLFYDFPFTKNPDSQEEEKEYSRINVYGLLLTSVIRTTIKSPVPLAIITKPQAGVGGTLIARIIHAVATGRDIEVKGAPMKEEEFEKKITTWLKEGSPLIVLDNISGKIDSPSLARVLTADSWSDRLLGGNTEGRYYNKSTWVATGNNIMLGGDLPRRCYSITLESVSARPWQEKRKFKHDDVIIWTLDNRGMILSAIFTLVKNWIAKGSKSPSEEIPLMGSFEDWRIVIGGILDCSGLHGFLGNLDQMYEDADIDTKQWEAFLEAIYLCYHMQDKGTDIPFTVGELTERISRELDSTDPTTKWRISLFHQMPDFLVDEYGSKKTFVRKLGKALSNIRNRVFSNGYVLKNAGKDHRVAKWKVIKKDTCQTNLTT